MAMRCGNCGAENDHATFQCTRPKIMRGPATDSGLGTKAPKSAGQAKREVSTDAPRSTPATGGTALLAPVGQCKHCDERRARDKGRVQKWRAKHGK